MFLSIDFQNKVNFACHQNDIGVLRDIVLLNSTDNNWKNIKIKMFSTPDFITPKIWQIESLNSQEQREIKDRRLELDSKFLFNLKEAINGEVIFQLIVDENLVEEQKFPIQLLAYNEWGGTNYIPELLAAFVTPNAKGIDKILGEVGQLLQKNNKDNCLNGYKDKSAKKVWDMTSALYSVLSGKDITYCLPPTSFEQNGQKIRMPFDLLNDKVATCLDTTVLFASALEQMGLYPTIILLKEHAFIGVWLKPTSLSNMIIDDAETVRKRVTLKELLVFETVAITNNPIPQFSYAQSLAEDKLGYGHDEDFELMLDIHLARGHQIRPIALFNENATNIDIQDDENQKQCTDDSLLEDSPNDLPDFSDEIQNDEDEREISAATRLNIWQKKLLNLSPSNPLLNCKINQSNLAILCPDPASLEDALADNVKMSLLSAEKVLKSKIDPELRALRTGENLWETQAREALKNKQLLVNVPEAKLSTQLVALFRKTKTILEEGGSNTLYLAIGFLNWKKKDKKDKVYHAPLILLPVKLERASVTSGVKLVAHEDESRFNTTLLQMLKQDFDINIPSLENDLPTDDSGLDVTEIWNRVRKAVKEVEGFEVVEEVVLGHFSFNKYLMWKDLVDRTDELMKHPFVASLIDKNVRRGDDGNFVKPEYLDELYKPEYFFAPLPMDSSQLAVLAAADAGKSFVIEGPPGTGKSQTITNLIAHLMAKGKTVLFVSEKMAALDVVYRRLAQIGLDKFCLQLHSNKANKKDVLNQLKLSWDNATNIKIENNWQNTASEILRLRTDLNNFVKELHQPGTQGFSPYYAMGVCIKNEDYAKLIKFNWAKSNIHNMQEYQTIKELVHKIQVQAEQCSGMFNSQTFNCIENTNWDPIWQNSIITESKNLSQLAQKLLKSTEEFISSIAISIEDIDNFKTIKQLYELAIILKNSAIGDANYAFCENGVDKIEGLENAIKHLKEYIKAKDALSCICPPDIWEKVDPKKLKSLWNLAEQKWFLPAFIDKMSITKTLQQAGAKGKISLPNDIDNISILKEHGTILQGLDDLLKDVNIWKIENSNISNLENSTKLARELRIITTRLAKGPEHLNKIREEISSLIIKNRDLLHFDGCIGLKISKFVDKYIVFSQNYKKLNEICNMQSIENLKINEDSTFTKLEKVSNFINFAKELSEHEGELKDWCYWQNLKTEAINKNLNSLIEAIGDKTINFSDIEIAFEAGYCNWWVQRILSENKVLRDFSSAQHIDKIERYKNLDDTFQKLTIEYIQASLANNIPNKEDKSLTQDWKFIQREMQKQRQIKPVRQILRDATGVVKTLAPCLMMSPLSVAQYLPVSQDAFDVVVFDEASQITVWDAIGSLSRGKQIIVAGDPKQMPPSNFFGRAIEYNEEELGLDEDLESILDELIGSSVPTLRLNWHYRSRCESLIAFSNDRYYDNSLVTFPAANTNQKSVSLREVPNGCYARNARINQEEAKALVAECVKRLSDPNPEIRNKSIGIVTFNSDQQKLIEDLLDAERTNHPEIEFAFGSDNQDSVFVKNLETVQGYERDVILFSVTYGPDVTGKVTMNFGPLNRSGGERRLNVAFTRAKYEMVIFSSLSPDQIDLNRTKSQGAADLKYFLQYAKQGKSALGSYTTGSLGECESPFEQEVANVLRQKGWNIHTQIGASSYRIDLAVVHPDKPGTYLAGIECDGATYHSSATARDRDKLRQSVLEGLGWHILRIWSTDWWTNKKGSIEKIDAGLKKLLAKDKVNI